MVINDRDIIQIDATVIAGLLILLSLSALQYGKDADTNLAISQINIVIFITISPFAFSAIFEIQTNIKENLAKMGKRRKISLALMMAGFMFTNASVGLIMLVQFLQTLK